LALDTCERLRAIFKFRLDRNSRQPAPSRDVAAVLVQQEKKSLWGIE